MEEKIERIASDTVDLAVKLHMDLGPGLLESVYEALMEHSLKQRGYRVDRQPMIPLEYNGVTLEEGFRPDLIVNQSVIIELKSVEHLVPVHGKQLLTYLRLSNIRLGLLINFGESLIRNGIKRVAN